MKPSACLGIASVVCLSAVLSAAQAPQSCDTVIARETAASPQLDNGMILYLELSKTVDAKKTRIGDEVSAILLADVLSHGKIAVHRDSKIIGHVTEALAHTKDNPESRLGIVFDTILVKHGPPIALSSVLLALRPAPEIQTEPPPTGGSHGPIPVAAHPSDWPYSAPTRSTSKLNRGADQEFTPPINNGAKMQVMEIEGLSLAPSQDGSSRVVVSYTRTVKLESRMRLELRVDNKPK